MKIKHICIRDWVALSVILVVAAGLRWVFFSGLFGSDEVTYTNQGLAISEGQWGLSNYVGAVRYGVNIPVAFFLKVFGVSELSANLWSLISSLCEIMIVFVFARQLWDKRTAYIASLIISFVPLHVHLAGRLGADAPLAAFITISFYVLWLAERKGEGSLYVLTGIAAGSVFWVKEVVFILFFPVLMSCAVFRKKNVKGWLLVLAGCCVMHIGYMVLMWQIFGDPLRIYRILVKGVQPNVEHQRVLITSPVYYLKYLFIDMRHTWLLGYLGLFGFIHWLQRKKKGNFESRDSFFILLWAFGLIFVLSCGVFSLKPLLFAPKQTNYMLIFIAPLVLLSGYFLAGLRTRSMLILLGLYLGGGFILSGLEQQAVHAFTGNSKAAVLFAQKHKDVETYGMTLARRAEAYHEIFLGQRVDNSIKAIEELLKDGFRTERRNDECPKHAYVIVDTETFGWSKGDRITGIDDIPVGWEKVEMLEPVGFGTGYIVTCMMEGIANLIPSVTINQQIRTKLEEIERPKPAFVYRTLIDCD